MHRLLRRAALAALAATALVPASADAAPKGLNIAGYDDVGVALEQGAKQIRVFAFWDQMEPNANTDFTKDGPVGQNPNFEALTGALTKILAGGATPIVVVVDSPAWASANGAAGRIHPRATKDYADFFGEFVAANKKLRGDGQTIVYEVWNEEDGKEFWGAEPDAAFYANMLKESYAAGKAADPGATILVGPTTGNNYQWINKLYENGAQGSFDGVAVHTDTACLDRGPDKFYRDPNPSGDPRAQGPLGQFTFLGYRSIRDVMLARGDDKPIWMTELGWSSTGNPPGPTSCARGDNAGKKPSGVTPGQQAAFMKQAYQCLAQDPYVVSAAWFTLRDTTNAPVEELNHYGLFGVDGGAKPSLAAFKSVDPNQAGECGDFVPPVVSVQAGYGGQFVEKLPIVARANDAGVGMGGDNSRITFQIDDNPALKINFIRDKVKNDVPVSYVFSGTKNLPNGPHVLRVYALDGNQNQTVTEVPIMKVAKLTANIRSKVTTKRPKCKGRTCTISGTVSATNAAIEGKVQVLWTFKNKKGKFKALHKATKNANKPFSVKQKLRSKGTWRVQVKYLGGGPIRPSKSLTYTLKVK